MLLLSSWDWLTHANIVDLCPVLLAQTPPTPTSPPVIPTANTAADIEVLKSQLEFLSQSQRQFIDAMKIIFTVLGIAGTLVAFFFGKSFKDFQELARRDVRDFQDFSKSEVEAAVQRVRQEAAAQIPHLVETEVGDLIRHEVTVVRRALQREQVIGDTIIGYLLLDGIDEPKEVALLKARRFGDVLFRTDIQSLQNAQRVRRSPIDVVVLDLINYITPAGVAFRDLSKPDRETTAEPILNELLALLPASAVIIVYVGFPPLQAVNNAPSDRYVIAANNPITLVGNAADGAYVVVGDRTSTH